MINYGFKYYAKKNCHCGPCHSSRRGVGCGAWNGELSDVPKVVQGCQRVVHPPEKCSPPSFSYGTPSRDESKSKVDPRGSGSGGLFGGRSSRFRGEACRSDK